LVRPEWRVLDPFAGTGRVHLLGAQSWGIEIEPEWASMHPRTIVGDALLLPFVEDSFDAVVTSCTYGNRLADHHEARDGSVRHSYRHDLGRALHPNNSGQFQWGERYREFHRAAWCEVKRVLVPDGRFLLNTSNHVRKHEVQDVNQWHFETLEDLGFEKLSVILIPTSRLRYGANSNVRVEGEVLSVWTH
jgi:tRNA G10  N-methylase Trm11